MRPERAKPIIPKSSEEWATSNVPFQKVDEYRERYVEHPIPARYNFKPVHVPLNTGHFAGDTENQSKYTQHHVLPRQKPKPVRNEWSRREDAPFEGHSVYDNDYKQVQIPKRYVHEKAVYIPNPNPIDSMTTNKADFPSWIVERRKIRERAPYAPNPAKMDGVSESSAQYRSWPVHMRPLTPKAVFVSPTEDREFTSIMRADFISHNVKRRIPRPPAKWIPSPGKFSGESVQHSDFKFVQSERIQPIKPSQTDSLTEKNKFEGQSEQHTKYQAWPTPKPPQKRTAKYNPNQAHFEGISTQKTDFQQWAINKVQPIKPSQIDSLTHKTHFEGRSEQSSMYTAWPTPKPPQKRIIPYMKNGFKFEGITTQRTDFVDIHQTSRTMSFSPQVKYKPIPEDRSFLTETKAALSSIMA
ncbi:hypothetical protein O9G_003736 [Rozella allomycis CSF55]|uniref:Uncharacterized protein n=1 Tax=Rozella allomycis (strain CSF55) TaxID=988480 RepID=A0A075AZN5_ROZAC|nr:hypothetical protein O9G_003736 [Rozella allomycis CSF55]|eukprot:EPZ34137.1 hypothetical protein O9G_003736 [Rozella allomycis CSF55]